MKDKPIIFSAPMIRALIAGRKTQTRRILKPQPGVDGKFLTLTDAQRALRISVGDRLWVRETWQYYDWTEDGEPGIRYAADNSTIFPPTPDDWGDRLTDIWAALSEHENYAIDNRARDRKWRPSIFMPRWASRITLTVTDERVQLLQGIDHADAVAEGVGIYPHSMSAQKRYIQIWDRINGHGAWDSNPWVAAYTFTVEQRARF
jgi:hypothetical protein